jgi:hypothetical protein
VLDGSGEEEVVGAFGGDGDADVGAVDVSHGAESGAGGDEVGAFEFDVGGGVVDVLGAGGVDAEEGRARGSAETAADAKAGADRTRTGFLDQVRRWWK